MGAVDGDCVSVIISQDWVESGLWPGGGGRLWGLCQCHINRDWVGWGQRGLCVVG